MFDVLLHQVKLITFDFDLCLNVQFDNMQAFNASWGRTRVPWGGFSSLLGEC